MYYMYLHLRASLFQRERDQHMPDYKGLFTAYPISLDFQN